MITREEAQALVDGHDAWHHSFEIFPGVRTPGSYDPAFFLDLLGLPENMADLRLIDVGASDGYLSREMHRRGAEVLAVDYRRKTVSGFAIMERLYGHEIPHLNANLYDIPVEELGAFDVVLCLGVVYHLPDIPRAIWLLRQLLKPTGHLFVESYVEDFATDKPMARYLPKATLNGDISNWWAPNVECVTAIVEDAGLQVERVVRWPERCLVSATMGDQDYKFRLAYGRMLDDGIG